MVRHWFGEPAGFSPLQVRVLSPPPANFRCRKICMSYQNIIQKLIAWIIVSGIKVVVILIFGLLIIRIANFLISKAIKTVIEKSEGKIQKERIKTLTKVFTSTLRIIIWVIVILMILPEFGISPTPFLAGAGLAGLAIGMGAKNLIQDYLAGLFILLEDQYRVGEEVEIGGKQGKVIDLNLRRTIVKDQNGNIHYIPNGQIKTASNLSRQ